MSEKEVLNVNLKRIKVGDDGIEMEWIEEKNGYFPNITEEFIYMRNLNYGFVENDNLQSEEKVEEPPKELPEWHKRLNKDFLEYCEKLQQNGNILSKTEYDAHWIKFYSENKSRYEKEEKKMIKESKKRSAKPNDGGWFEMDDDKNRFVYVENLPLDITIEEFVKEMSRAGMIMNDFQTHQPRARLYKQKDDITKNKGDGIICYMKVESIDIAIKHIDGSNIRGNEIKVSRAKFEVKEGFDPTKRRKLTNKEKKKRREHEEKLFSWSLDTKSVRPKKDNTVILKNAFDFELMKDNPDKAIDIKEKLTATLKNVGPFRSIKVHDLHSEGVVQIEFHDANYSDVAVTYFNDKLWNGRKIEASLWDGKTRYKIKETEEQEKERIAKWEKKLEGDCDTKNKKESRDDDDGGSETGEEDVGSD